MFGEPKIGPRGQLTRFFAAASFSAFALSSASPMIDSLLADLSSESSEEVVMEFGCVPHRTSLNLTASWTLGSRARTTEGLDVEGSSLPDDPSAQLVS